MNNNACWCILLLLLLLLLLLVLLLLLLLLLVEKEAPSMKNTVNWSPAHLLTKVCDQRAWSVWYLEHRGGRHLVGLDSVWVERWMFLEVTTCHNYQFFCLDLWNLRSVDKRKHVSGDTPKSVDSPSRIGMDDRFSLIGSPFTWYLKYIETNWGLRVPPGSSTCNSFQTGSADLENDEFWRVRCKILKCLLVHSNNHQPLVGPTGCLSVHTKYIYIYSIYIKTYMVAAKVDTKNSCQRNATTTNQFCSGFCWINWKRFKHRSVSFKNRSKAVRACRQPPAKRLCRQSQGHGGVLQVWLAPMVYDGLATSTSRSARSELQVILQPRST